MASSVELRQQRARVVESLRSVTETAERENRNLNADERSTYDNHEAEFRSLTERIERAEAMEQRENEQARSIGNGGQPDAPANPEQRAQQARSAFLAFVRRGAARLAPEQRALVEDATGEILVPEELEQEIYREIPALTVMRQLATVRTIATNRVRRRSLNELTVGWGKLETKAAGALATRESSLVPSDDWSYVEDLYGLTKIGEDELDDTDVNLEAAVRDSFSRGIAEAEDTGYAVGTGHANEQPLGVFATGTGIATVASGQANVAAGVSVDDFIKLIYAVPAQYRRNGNFLLSSASELSISTLKDANGNYLWQPSVQAGRPNTFKGYSLYNQEDVPAWAVNGLVAAFGDFKAGYRILDRQGMTVQRLVELYAEDGLIGFKVRRRVGGDVVRPNALRILKAPAV